MKWSYRNNVVLSENKSFTIRAPGDCEITQNWTNNWACGKSVMFFPCSMSGIWTGQGVPGVCVWRATAGRASAQPLPVPALWASQHRVASPSAAPVTAGLPVQLPSNHRWRPQTEVWRNLWVSSLRSYFNLEETNSTENVLTHIIVCWF